MYQVHLQYAICCEGYARPESLFHKLLTYLPNPEAYFSLFIYLCYINVHDSQYVLIPFSLIL